MRRVVMLLVVTPACLVAQTPTRTGWFTTIGEIHARRDGWVEWRIAPPSVSWRGAQPSAEPPHQEEFYGISARFAPDSVRVWVAAARRMLADTTGLTGKASIPELTDGEAGVSLAVHREATRLQYEMFTSGCRGGWNPGASRGDVLLLLDALAEAARAAAAMRPSPADRGSGPFSASEVTCPARQERAYMPAWSSAFGRRPRDRGEALAHFVVTADGRVDTSTVVWDRAPATKAESAARAALANWRFAPARIGRRPVQQWAHVQLWFADSIDAAELQLAGRARTRSFVARSDGRIEHVHLIPPDTLWRPNEALRIREAYTPSQVRAWLQPLSAADRRAAELVAPGGLSWRNGWYEGCAGPAIGTGVLSGAAWSSLADSAWAALVAATRRSLVPVDSTRVHGETEVTCPARPFERVSAIAHLRTGDEVVLSFVVRRDGRVDSASVALLGVLDADAASLARKAVFGEKWEPGRLGGVRVSQRAHLVLYPAPEPDADLATVSCVQASGVAVRLRLHEPAKGIAPTELARIAHAFSKVLGLQGRPSATNGSFTVVLDDLGAPHFFTWIRAPSDTAGADAATGAFASPIAGLRAEIVAPSPPAAPLAVEADLLPQCP